MSGYTFQEINQMPSSDFVAALGHIYEHSPWVIEAAAEMRPFRNLKTLQAGCESALFGAETSVQLELIQAHPDLAAKLDQLPKLTDFSQAEQKRAGFAALPTETLAQMRAALEAYRDKFDHPFILCVTEHPAEDVLPLLEIRLTASADAERLTCLYQIARIGWHRISSLIAE